MSNERLLFISIIFCWVSSFICFYITGKVLRRKRQMDNNIDELIKDLDEIRLNGGNLGILIPYINPRTIYGHGKDPRNINDGLDFSALSDAQVCAIYEAISPRVMHMDFPREGSDNGNI